MNSASPTSTVAQQHHADNYESFNLYAYGRAVFTNKHLSPALERKHGVEGLPLDDARYLAARDKAFMLCRPAQMTPAAFVEHVLSGAAWTPGYFDGETYADGTKYRRRNQNWQSSQFLVLDFDDHVSVADVLRYDLVKQYALLVHPSASSKPEHYKTRVIFLLDEPMAGNVDTWKRAQRGLIAQFEQAADPQSIVASQPYFGSTNRSEAPHINLDARLPLALALEWAGEIAQQDAAKEAERRAKRDTVKRVTVTGSRAEKYAQAAVDRLIADLASAPEGTHHAALVKTAAQLANMAAGGWPVGAWDADLTDAARTRASAAEITAAIEWAEKHAAPRPLELPERQRRSARTRQDAPKQPYKIEHPHTPLKGARVVNQPYIELPDDIDRYKVIVIRSPIGTGKTRAALELAQRARTVVHMSHRRKLAENAANNANQHGVTFEYYRELRRDDMRRVPRHTTCINTYASLATVDESIPVPELMIADEYMQTLEHVTGGHTFKTRGSAQIAYDTIEYAVKHAKQSLILDAHMDDAQIDRLRGWVGAAHVLVIDNAYQPERGDLYLYETDDAAISAGLAMAQTDGAPVVMACMSARQAGAVALEATQRLGSDAVLLIHARNSGQARQAAFLRDPDCEAQKYKLIIYSPVLESGIDINAPVRAVFLIGMNNRNAYAHAQMAGRFRKAVSLHAYVPDVQEGNHETDEHALFDAIATAADDLHRELAPDGRLAIAPKQAQFLRTYAQLSTRSNASLNRLREHFLELMNGYTAHHVEGGRDRALCEQLKAARKAATDEIEALMLTADPVTPADYERALSDGIVSQVMEAGYRRYVIEDLTKFPIGADDIERYRTPAARKAYDRLCNALDSPDALRADDLDDALAGVPLHQYKHRITARNIFVEFTNALTDGAGARVFTEAQIEQTFAPLIDKYRTQLRAVFGYRHDRTQRAVTAIRAVLKKHGLKLASDRKMVNGERVRLYQLDSDHATGEIDRAHATVEQRQALREAEQVRPHGWLIAQNRPQSRSSLGCFGQRTSHAPPIRPPALSRSGIIESNMRC